ncbi:hypothetical protein CsSME_00045728 [Camellia sinensis var. sinensis]
MHRRKAEVSFLRKFFGILVVMAGTRDQCSNRRVKRFTEQLSKWSKSEGYCMLKKFVTRWCISMATFGGSIVLFSKFDFA